MVFEYLT